ncbi:hypothetical protein C8Q80DRAFT_1167549 [Daedaleopsis nitida]|nr:hypothetical protein C8Q80DRAFT_1167549 [Daedaleopsis nitida]
MQDLAHPIDLGSLLICFATLSRCSCDHIHTNVSLSPSTLASVPRTLSSPIACYSHVSSRLRCSGRRAGPPRLHSVSLPATLESGQRLQRLWVGRPASTEGGGKQHPFLWEQERRRETLRYVSACEVSKYEGLSTRLDDHASLILACSVLPDCFKQQPISTKPSVSIECVRTTLDRQGRVPAFSTKSSSREKSSASNVFHAQSAPSAYEVSSRSSPRPRSC